MALGRRCALASGSMLASAPPCVQWHKLLAAPVLLNLVSSGSQRSKAPSLLPLLGFAGLAAALAQERPWDAQCAPTAPGAVEQSGYVVDPATRKKYGRYVPWCRLNVDQVPLPFVNDMETTYEERGVKRVTINQLGPSLGKRQATGQICFRPMVPPPTGCTDSAARALYDQHLQAQPAPCIIFRGQGNITDFEKSAYPPGLVVLWQAKAWVDRPVAKEWVEDVIGPFIEAERKAGVASTDTQYVLFQDNLDSQKQPEYISLLKSWGVDDHKLPPNETDQVQPIDRGLGRHVKIYLGQLMDEWLDDHENLEKWEENKLTASDRRILLANWYYTATVRALEGDAKLKYFQHAGALLTADGTDDDLIKLEGTPVGYQLAI
jgi:hypothetical protein